MNEHENYPIYPAVQNLAIIYMKKFPILRSYLTLYFTPLAGPAKTRDHTTN